MIEGMHRKNFLCGFIGEMQKEGRDVSTIWKIPRMSKSVIALRDGGRTASVCLSLRLCHGHGFAVRPDPIICAHGRIDGHRFADCRANHIGSLIFSGLLLPEFC
jgi:hypothetical protein